VSPLTVELGQLCVRLTPPELSLNLGALSMANFIYNPDGVPQGFRLSNHIYDFTGTAVGRV
jgi:hypothetical protein